MCKALLREGHRRAAVEIIIPPLRWRAARDGHTFNSARRQALSAGDIGIGMRLGLALGGV
jgi:hypothetical protein